jgi:hypothetical protein
VVELDGTTTVTEAVLTTEPIATEPRPTYAQDWAAYTRAQCEEQDVARVLLRGLCDGIVQPAQGMGRKRLPLADVVYGATMKVYSTMSGRRATSDLRACAAQGLMAKAPNHNSLFRYLEQPELTPLLTTLVGEAALPLRAVESAFATDSTGFSTCTYGRWYDEKYGQAVAPVLRAERRVPRPLPQAQQRRECVLDGQAQVWGERPIGPAGPRAGDRLWRGPQDASERRPAPGAAAQVAEGTPHGGLLLGSNENLVAVEAVGAVPYVPFKSNSRGTGGSDAWRRTAGDPRGCAAPSSTTMPRRLPPWTPRGGTCVW